MKPNFDNCSDIKGLRFFTKEICPYYCHFLHTQKDSGGASIYRIDESFPKANFSLNPSPLTLTILFKKWSFPGMLLALIGGCKCALSLATRRGYTSL